MGRKRLSQGHEASVSITHLNSRHPEAQSADLSIVIHSTALILFLCLPPFSCPPPPLHVLRAF